MTDDTDIIGEFSTTLEIPLTITFRAPLNEDDEPFEITSISPVNPFDSAALKAWISDNLSNKEEERIRDEAAPIIRQERANQIEDREMLRRGI